MFHKQTEKSSSKCCKSRNLCYKKVFFHNDFEENNKINCHEDLVLLLLERGKSRGYSAAAILQAMEPASPDKLRSGIPTDASRRPGGLCPTARHPRAPRVSCLSPNKIPLLQRARLCGRSEENSLLSPLPGHPRPAPAASAGSCARLDPGSCSPAASGPASAPRARAKRDAAGSRGCARCRVRHTSVLPNAKMFVL